MTCHLCGRPVIGGYLDGRDRLVCTGCLGGARIAADVAAHLRERWRGRGWRVTARS